MTRFIGLSVAVSLATLVAACSSSPSSSDDAGSGNNGNPGVDSGGTQPVTDASPPSDTGPGTNQDSSPPSTDGGACAPIALPSGDGGVPAYTAPKLDQGVCAPTDISTFVTACSGSGAGCSAWAQSNATTTCGECLFSSGAILAPLELFSIGTEGYLLPSIGSCVLASEGTGAASCAEAADEADYCVNYVCAQCAAGTGDACVSTASSGVCASSGSQFQTACGAYATAVGACQKAQGTAASMTNAANVICGSGAVDAGDQ